MAAGRMPTLTQRAAGGVKWTGASMVVTTIMQFGQLAVLTRLLPRADFGIMAMIMVVIVFGQAYADMGISNAIIWRQDTTRDQLSSLYWLNVLAGVAVFAVVLVLTPFVAAFYKQPALETYLPWSALVFLLVPFGQQFQMLLQKELRFRVIASIEMCSAALGAAVAILAALAGAGVYSLILGQLTSAAARAIGLAAVGWREWRPGVHFRFSDLHGYLGFGLYQMGERSISQLTANMDYLVIGRVLGATVLGVYSIAYQLVVMPIQKINPVLTRVAFPVFSLRQADSETLKRGYCQLSALLASCVLPVLAGLLVGAPVVVPVLFGPSWSAAIPLVQVLSVMSMFRTLSNPSGSILLARGRADLGFKINAVFAPIVLFAFVLAVHYGALGVAWAWVAITASAFIVVQSAVQRVIGLSWRAYGRSLLRPLLVMACATGLLQLAYSLLQVVLSSSLIILLLLLVIGLTTYLVLWWIVDRRFLAAALSMLKPSKPETA